MGKILAAIVVLLLIVLAVFFFSSDVPVMEVSPQLKVVGTDTSVKVHITDPHGIRDLKAYIEQDGKQNKILETTQPSSRFKLWGKHLPAQDVTVGLGKKYAPALHDGKARVVIEATSNDFRGATATYSSDVDVNTKPPMLSPDGFQHYINQGGSELVTFHVSGYWTEAGVRVGKYTFRSWPMPGKPENSEDRFSLFAFPWDVPTDVVPVVYARNPAGNEVQARFWYKLFPKPVHKKDFALTDAFLGRVVNQIEPGSGDLLQRFLKINGEMRRDNNKTLSDLRFKTEEKVLWTGPFIQLGNSKVEAQFADERTYLYGGKKVDTQMHLGFDLSVTAHVPIVAENTGKIVWAGPLGIYGNCVVIDHGYSLQSIYGHLSEIGVKVGDSVNKGQQIGKSGATGLAGGDHLHYSMQVDGIQVNPVEWWDEHWIHDRILSKIGQ